MVSTALIILQVTISGDAFLKKCQADVELLTEMEHSEIVEIMIRDVVSSVFDRRLFKRSSIQQL